MPVKPWVVSAASASGLEKCPFLGLLKNLMLIESGKSLFLLHYFLHPYFITIAPLFRDLNLEALKREM